MLESQGDGSLTEPIKTNTSTGPILASAGVNISNARSFVERVFEEFRD